MDDKINRPSHYQGDGMEVIDIIEAFNLGFNEGNAIKYILRCKKKSNQLEDLEKAAWYINREIETLLKNAMKWGLKFEEMAQKLDDYNTED